MKQIVLASLVWASLALVACGGGASTPAATASPTGGGTPPVRVTPGDRPMGIPRTARAVVETTTLGTITRKANQPPQGNGTRTLLDARCEGGQISFTTSEETIYAPHACDGFWDDKAKQLFVGKEVAIVLEVTSERLRILIDTLEGARSEFTVSGIWLQ